MYDARYYRIDPVVARSSRKAPLWIAAVRFVTRILREREGFHVIRIVGVSERLTKRFRRVTITVSPDRSTLLGASDIHS